MMMMVGDEGLIKAEGIVCEEEEVEKTVFVAVGKNVKEGKSLLSWALKSFPGSKLCLLHVHQPTHLLSLMDGKILTSKLQELAHQKMHKLLDQYLLYLAKDQIQSGKVWIEMSNIQKGIVKVINELGVKRLVFGAASEKQYSKKLVDVKSIKAIYVREHAPISCHIWFICKGCLISTKSDNREFNSSSIVTMPSINGKGKTLAQNFEEDAINLDTLKHLNEKVEQINGDLDSTEMRANSLPSYSVEKLTKPLNRSLSLTLQGNIHQKLEQAMIHAENLKQKAFEESLKRWRAEEDAMDAIQKAKALEDLCNEETNQRKELEENLSAQRQEFERLKNQRDQNIKEIEIIQTQKPILEARFKESCSVEEELEEKINQAVKLLITFKEKRDELQKERDFAIKEVFKLRKPLNEDLFKYSFSDIVDATQNFDPSWKIHEGRTGILYKGNLGRTKVAIKIFPSCKFKSEHEFEYQVEILSRVRHPHIVTLMGICSESRSLIYEYLENGSLEDYLSEQRKSEALPWQSRIRIAIEICSALFNLHDSDSRIIHGNLKPSKILLDSNFVSKITGIGSYLLIGENPNDFENSPYMDPEYIENRALTIKSDVYSYGVILLRLLTARSALNIVKDVTCAFQSGNLNMILDNSGGEWPLDQANRLVSLALKCCEKKRENRPNLVSEVWDVISPMRDLCVKSTLSCLNLKNQRKIPSHFVCPIFQEVMKDPYIAADGFTYEGDAIKGWLNSGHKSSPMTNLQLDHCDLIPNYAIYYAIQEWQK